MRAFGGTDGGSGNQFGSMVTISGTSPCIAAATRSAAWAPSECPTSTRRCPAAMAAAPRRSSAVSSWKSTTAQSTRGMRTSSSHSRSMPRENITPANPRIV